MTRYDDQEYYNPNHTILHRILGGGSTEIIVDYSVFGMVSFTLPLLLLVEIVRHRIDKRALIIFNHQDEAYRDSSNSINDES